MQAQRRVGQAGQTRVICSVCGLRAEPGVREWRCECGGCWDLKLAAFDRLAIEPACRAPWRYPFILPAPLKPCTLGEGGTPLVSAVLEGLAVQVKLEFLQPTGCHKDRGSSVLAAALRAAGVQTAIEDSSGNAGASLAAYAARAGVRLELYVPSRTPVSKLRQASAYGAQIDRSAEDREAAARLARQAVSDERPYASHVFSPFFLAGQASLALELWEDLERQAPDAVVVPLGNGILLYGLYLGFAALRAGGCIRQLPRLIGVQAAACAPLATAFASGADDVVGVPARPTRAVGVRVAAPPRARSVLNAVRVSDGLIVAVSERAIAKGVGVAARHGWYLEPSAATAVAALSLLRRELSSVGRIVVVLTGSGLKA